MAEHDPESGLHPGFDTTVAHPARVYDYWLGGKDNFAADKRAAEAVIAVRPSIIRDIRANREFLGRAVRYLATEVGIRQFLDVGTGIPAANNTHEVAQSVARDAKIVYVDNDPIVLAHARALLASTPQGECAYLDADLRDPDKVLEMAAGTLDFDEPVAVLYIGVLHLVADDEDPYGIVARSVAATVPGSYLAVTQPASDVNAQEVAESARQYNQNVVTKQTRRTREQTLRFFGDMELVPPGLVQCHRWHPEPGAIGLADNVSCWGGIARKS